jgi:hypothetical protein
MRFHLGFLPFAAVCLTLLAGCTNATPVNQGDYNVDARYRRNGQADPDTPLFKLGGNSQSTDSDSSSALAVNAYLWRGALDTLSFMPLASADPFGGVIITDWYQPPAAAGERFKATAYILGRQLRSDGVRVSVFRQVEQGGQWVDAPVNTAMASDIENKVLARARELRTRVPGPS